jgi:homoserine dehydrogenase
VLRYIVEFDIINKKIEVKLVSEPINSFIGQLKDAENLIEIYTETNGLHPIVVKGNTAGKEIVVRTLIQVILKISNRIQQNEALLLYN